MKCPAIVLAAGLVVMASTTSYAQVTLSGSVETVSQYVWRGYALVEGTSMQPALDVAWEDKGLSLSLWASVALIHRDRHRTLDEVDLTVNYALASGSWGSVDVGFIIYSFPNQDQFSFKDHTSPEAYITVAPNVPLSPEVFLAYDANLGDDLYASLGVGHALSVAGQPFELGVTAGYNNGQFEADDGFSHLDLSVSTDLELGPVNLAPRAVYVHSFENTLNEGNRVFFGVGLGW
ncbi:MAG: TorF family putative porin [Rhodothermales bacterium]